MESIFSIIGSFIPFVVLMGVVVTVHELGHYLAGRSFGAAVESFALGFGDAIFERTDKRGTRWRLNWVPLGGFVKFVGEAQAPGDAGILEKGPVGRAYTELAPWQRVIVSLAGPAINFVFAIFVFAVLALSFPQPVLDGVKVEQVIAGGAGDKAGFKVGDVFVTAGGRKVERSSDVLMATVYSAGERVEYVVRRGDALIELVAVPEAKLSRDERLGIEEEVGMISIAMQTNQTGTRRVGPVEAVAIGADRTVTVIQQTIKVLRRLVTGKDSFEKMRGPLGIGDLADRVVDGQLKRTDIPLIERLENTAWQLLSMSALFSVSIGFFNLLPIPMLDGYSAMLGIFETVSGSALSERIQDLLLRGGLAAIGLFFIAVTWNDLKRLDLLEVFGRLLS